MKILIAECRQEVSSFNPVNTGLNDFIIGRGENRGSTCCALRRTNHSPSIGTGGILEHYVDREEGVALHKLAMQSFPGDEAAWRNEFLDALAQLDKQTRQQRVDELQQKGPLDDSEKAELRELMLARMR